MFHCWKANRGLKLSRNAWEPEKHNSHIHDLSYCNIILGQFPIIGPKHTKVDWLKQTLFEVEHLYTDRFPKDGKDLGLRFGNCPRI
jgi:hypothetical protein